MGDSRRNSETDSGRKEGQEGVTHIPTQKRMLSIQDVPGLLEIEGKEILAIPTRIESELRQVILQRGQGTHDRSDGGDNVQILERVAFVSKEQMITLAEDGMEKYSNVQIKQRQIAEEKWRVFVENVWGYLMNQITEKVSELRTMFNEDVQMKLDTACVNCIGWT